ncbi:hypothetical protein [Spirosoma montaniterrae]|uniref:Outer membrane protein beta-barrel domain-containing protein n=1 Tax=Spirosoma montaniterrae TaxID=1178516 RepID=A0A1P9X3I5_9BACT|nr:hypothetical protein [Spirosoma montaniterrae]AQG82167.1 hypothetical protein AWR27_24450 [Spirosoma montaniterrae]
MKTRHRFCLLIVLLINHISTFAQRSAYWHEKPGTWLLNVGTGATRYAGDLAEAGNLAHLQLGAALGVAGTYRATQRLSWRAEAQLYYVYGWQKYTRNYYNNLSFNSLNPDVWAGIQFDFWPVNDPHRATIPYAMAGVGLTHITPKARYEGQNYSLPQFETEGVAYNRLPLIIRYGVGLPMLSTERLRFHLEGTYTHVLSDYFDDVSSIYIDRSNMTPLGAALTDRRAELGTTLNRPGEQRGNTGKNDGYFVLSGRLVVVIITPQQRNYRRMFGR